MAAGENRAGSLMETDDIMAVFNSCCQQRRQLFFFGRVQIQLRQNFIDDAPVDFIRVGESSSSFAFAFFDNFKLLFLAIQADMQCI